MLGRREALALGVLPWLGAAASGNFDRQKWRPGATLAGRNPLVLPGGTPAPPGIRPRSAWATNHPVRGKLAPEADVRFLLVHHTLTPNTDTPEKIAGRIRSIYAFHTGERGWADVAYNFFVDPSGVIWEGREGSLAGPVRADATGGSQGFAQLACFVGDFTSVPPTSAAMDAMVRLLAWLAARSSLPLEGTTTFVSRGSSRWARGVEVTTARIAAHRDMSVTECPGDALYPLVAGDLLPRAAALAGGSGFGEPGASGASGASGGSGGGHTPGPGEASGSTGSVPDEMPGGANRTGGSAGRIVVPGIGELPVEGVVAGMAGVALVGGAVAWGVRSAHEKERGERESADEQRDDQPDEEPDERL